MAAVTRYPAAGSRLAPHLAGPGTMPGGTLTAGDGGLMIGRDRHRNPVVLRLLRAEHTRGVLVGGVSVAQLITFRVIALGARVVVQTLRPQQWASFTQRTGIGSNVLAFTTPGERLPPTATAARPEVVVVDVGALNWNTIDTTCPWRATVVVRHEIVTVDADLLAGADLAIMQPLTTAEASIAAPALGIIQTEPWLSRINTPMVTIASQGTARWATLEHTETELRTIGPAARLP